MEDNVVCMICGGGLNDYRFKNNSDTLLVDCLNCSTYTITRPARVLLKSEKLGKYSQDSLEKRKSKFVSAYLRVTRNVIVDSEFVESIRNFRELSSQERVDRYLGIWKEKATSLSDVMDPTEKEFQIVTALSAEELSVLVAHLQKRGFLDVKEKETVNSRDEARLTMDGWAEIEKLNSTSGSTNVFIALWFDEMFRRDIEPIIRSAIESVGLVPLTVDQDQHNEKIDDKIIRDINRSAAVVADLSDHRPNVYFEAGYALGKGIPIVWTCRESDRADVGFDIRQYNCIYWKSGSDLCTQLEARLSVMFGADA